LHENIMVGSIPGYLGHYSPLLLAASVGSYEIVKLLHSKYDADIHLLGGRYRDTTAIDCARHHFWLGISQERTNKKIDIIQYLQSHNAKTGNEQRKIVQNLCKAAYRGDNTEIQSILTTNPASVNQTVSDAIFGGWASFLGVYSPLMAAVVNNKLQMVKLLVEQYHADVNLLNGRSLDYTVLDYAKHYQF
jgi:hypothetical protein